MWQTIINDNYTYSDISGINVDFLSNELTTVLTYLDSFAPVEEKAIFESRISTILKSKCMIEKIDKAMIRVFNYYDNGPLYHDIISKTYLVSTKISEKEIMCDLNLERSTYYRKKKEAIMLFAISLWGYEIMELK